MNGEHLNSTTTQDDDVDENPSTNFHASGQSSNTGHSLKKSALTQPQQQGSRRRAFFHDDVIVPNHQHSSIIDDNQQILSTINDDDDDTVTEHHSSSLSNNNVEDNPTNKPFKRKVVSFSTMPFEKKVADGMSFFFLSRQIEINRVISFCIHFQVFVER